MDLRIAKELKSQKVQEQSIIEIFKVVHDVKIFGVPKISTIKNASAKHVIKYRFKDVNEFDLSMFVDGGSQQVEI